MWLIFSTGLDFNEVMVANHDVTLTPPLHPQTALAHNGPVG